MYKAVCKKMDKGVVKMEGEQTTIRVDNQIKKRLEELKLVRQESMNDVIVRVLKLLANAEYCRGDRLNKLSDNEGIINKKTTEMIRKRLLNVELGQVYSTKEMDEIVKARFTKKA